MKPFHYPQDEDAPDDYLQNTHWLAVPVSVKDGIENCYLSGTGVADFTDDPDWVEDHNIPVVSGKFRLKFISKSPLEPDDVFNAGSALATVGFAHIDRDATRDSWLMALETVNVSVVTITKDGVTQREIWVDIAGAFRGDVWMDKIAFQVGLLVYRPSFLKPPPTPVPHHLRIQDLIGLVRPLHGQP